MSLERFQTLALEASARLKAFGLNNASVMWGDGYDYHEAGKRFDKVIVHGLIEPPAQEFLKLIAGAGVLASAFSGPGRGEQRIVRLAVGKNGPVGILEFGRGRALRPLERGLSRGL